MKTFRELVRDSLFAIIFHLAPRFANVVVFIIIGRVSGPDQAGVFTLATTYLLIFTTLMRGADDFVVRQVARETDRAADYFVSFLLLRAILSALACVTLWLLLGRVLDYPPATQAPVAILALAILPDGLLLVGQAVLLGLRHFKVVTLIVSIGNVVKLVAAGWIIARGGSVSDVAWMWLAGSVGMMVAMSLAAIRLMGGWAALGRVDRSALRLIAQHRWAILSFLAITALSTVEAQVDTILLSVYRSESDVGWYNAATTVTFSLVMLSQAYRFSVYPMMARFAQQAPEKLNRLYDRSMRYLSALVVPMVIGIMVLAPQIVSLVFGAKFAPTSLVLQILVVSLIFIFLDAPTVRMLLVHDRQHVIAQIGVVSAVCNVAFNLLLLPHYGAVGAAIARVISEFSASALCYVYLYRRIIKLKIHEVLSRPILASGVMVIVLWLMGGLSMAITIPVGAAVYVLIFLMTGGLLATDREILHSTILSRLKKPTY